jgi:hypothetical protein
VTTQEVQRRLEATLRRLQRQLHGGYEVSVQWAPDELSSVSGDVRNGTIYVYEVKAERAVAVLTHEFLDHLLTSELVQPLVRYVNLQKGLIEHLIYQRKERLVERLALLLAFIDGS